MGNFDGFSKQKNSFFHFQDEYANEKRLYDLLQTEMINLHGVCLLYFTATYDVNYNRIWGEDNNRRYVRKFNMMGIYDLPKEEDNFTRFGVEPFDTVVLWASKSHFAQASRYDHNGRLQPELSSYIPKVSDVIKAEYNDYYYEIVDVSEEEEMFEQTKHSWQFTLRPFKDEHIMLDNSSGLPYQTSAILSGDIGVVTDKATDIFDIRSTIDTKKVPIIYTPKVSEQSRNTNKYGWW